MSGGPIKRHRTLVIGCGALAREIADLVEHNGLTGIDVEYLPAKLHNTPGLIPNAIEQRIIRARKTYDHLFVAYADCGTGGLLDRVLERHGVERLDGNHCYQFFAGQTRFDRIAAEELGTFFLTDFLAKHFDRLVWGALGMRDHPELRDLYFGNYTRLVFLSQRSDPDTEAKAKAAADRLGLTFEHRHVGYGDLESALLTIGRQPPRENREEAHAG